MRLSTWRQSIVDWVAQKVQIDTYELRNPEVVGETAGFFPPLRNIKHYDGGEESEGQPTAQATQEIYITTRYPRDTPYAELPLATTEGVYSSLCQGLLKDAQGIADLIDLWINPSDQPIQVSEVGDDYGDWLVTMVIYVVIKWLPEPEPGFGFSGYTINKIAFNLYRAKLDNFNDNTLVATFGGDRELLTAEDDYVFTEPPPDDFLVE
ncbi:MAG: hypothetical protein KME59_21535 [Trichormus sp. ATA11-4-KO1]|jgi:hypothetical protein|nr:hypothetical protein [Trichormus sp. ATA11-4-KO1]